MLRELIPGSVITKIPINPTKTANHLNNPTFSFYDNVHYRKGTNRHEHVQKT